MIRIIPLLWIAAAIFVLGMSRPPPNLWANPTPVAIIGYDDHAMEPFVAGEYLFWNNSNKPAEETNLHWGVFVDPVTVQYLGVIPGADGPGLDGEASLAQGRLYFNSPARGTPRSAIVSGEWISGNVLNVGPVPGDFVDTEPGRYAFGPEVSPDGAWMYYVQSVGGTGPNATAMNIRAARWTGTEWVRASDSLLANVKCSGKAYAPAISADGLEIYFTCLASVGPPVIMMAVRSRVTRPFGQPIAVSGITGKVEGPTITADGKTLYYHRQHIEPGGDGLYHIWKVER